MNMLKTVAFSFAALAVSTTLAMAGGEGVWKTPPFEKMTPKALKGSVLHIKVEEDGTLYTGIIVAEIGPDGKKIPESNLIGRVIAKDISLDGAKGGNFFHPYSRTLKKFSSKGNSLSPDGDEMSVAGCVLGMCEAQTWTRIK